MKQQKFETKHKQQQRRYRESKTVKRRTKREQETLYIYWMDLQRSSYEEFVHCGVQKADHDVNLLT